MKKVCIILAIVLSLSLVLSACGGNAANEAPAQTSGSGDGANDTVKQTSSNNSTADTSSPVSTQTGASSITEYTLAKYRNYSDGVAWVRGLDEVWYCIDKKGNILFDLEAGSVPVSDFTDGIAVVENDLEFRGITTENKIVASLQKSDYTLTKYADGNAVYVNKETKTLEGNTNEYGLFDMSKNEWLIPLGEPRSQGLPLWDAGRNLEYLYLYGGHTEGVYAVSMKDITMEEFEVLIDSAESARCYNGIAAGVLNMRDIFPFYNLEKQGTPRGEVETFINNAPYRVTSVKALEE